MMLNSFVTELPSHTVFGITTWTMSGEGRGKGEEGGEEGRGEGGRGEGRERVGIKEGEYKVRERLRDILRTLTSIGLSTSSFRHDLNIRLRIRKLSTEGLHTMYKLITPCKGMCMYMYMYMYMHVLCTS